MSDTLLTFLADESLEYRLVLFLRDLGYDIFSISEDSPSISDEEVLAKAYAEKRIVLTNDKDFGDLIFLNKLSHKGVVLFRLKADSALTAFRQNLVR